MQIISPVHEATIAPFIGRCVGAVLIDGTCLVGRLVGISDGNVILEIGGGPAVISSKNVNKTKKQLMNELKKAKTSAFVPYYNPAAAAAAAATIIAIALALLALLFVI
ncbi:hypothetical protein [Paenibacillus sp.]|jgi:hypothetical protein|uniref:hypothetical protein n=1 Tax=Paenibacillus sp. TaxID=58172 RepID=UPI003564E173